MGFIGFKVQDLGWMFPATGLLKGAFYRNDGMLLLLLLFITPTSKLGN